MLFGLFFGWVATASYSGGTEVGYNKDVRKILSANCFSCHGQDAKSRKGGLRLDDDESALGREMEFRQLYPVISMRVRLGKESSQRTRMN